MPRSTAAPPAGKALRASVPLDLPALRRHAIARSLFKPTSLPAAIARMGFLQADPIRAPARAQDLTLRHRVSHYRAGELERRYPRLALEEDFFVNYGFLPTGTQRLMHPRAAGLPWPRLRSAKAAELLAFVRERGEAHPREVDEHFQHGHSRNWFGGSSKASTQLLDAMHYRGMLRVARRVGGIRVYAAAPEHPLLEDVDVAMDALVDVIVSTYAPLPEPTLSQLVHRLQLAVPHWPQHRKPALARARARLPHAQVDGLRWFWPADESPASRRHGIDEAVRLLAPFDPVVWDRRRFELFWGWAYRFEAYTPPAKRLRGYYALPLLWREQVIGWANLSVKDDRLQVDAGYVAGRAPREPGFRAALQAEAARMAEFLGVQAP